MWHVSKAAELGTVLFSNSAVRSGTLVRPGLSWLLWYQKWFLVWGQLHVSYLGNMELESESINRYMLIKRCSGDWKLAFPTSFFIFHKMCVWRGSTGTLTINPDWPLAKEQLLSSRIWASPEEIKKPQTFVFLVAQFTLNENMFHVFSSLNNKSCIQLH